MICTDLQQSRDLIELGIDPKTSDMYHSITEDDPDYILTEINNLINWDEIKVYDRAVPAWSIDALAKLLPVYIHTPKGSTYKWRLTVTGINFVLSYINDDHTKHDSLTYFVSNSIVGAYVGIIKWVIKNKIPLNKSHFL